MGASPLLTDPGFILEPDLDALAGMKGGGFHQLGGKPAFLEGFLSLRIASGVLGTRFLARQSQAPHDARQAGRVNRLAETAGDHLLAQHRQRPVHAAVPFQVRPCQNGLFQDRPFVQAQPGRPTGGPTVVKAGHPLGIVADHRVAQRLAVQASQPCRLRSPHAVQRMGDRQHPRHDPPLLLLAGLRTERVGAQIASQR
jgi:hypothetical protein